MMLKAVFIEIFLLSVAIFTQALASSLDWKLKTNTLDYARQNGYAAKDYTVVTEDGYFITMFRICGTIEEIGDETCPEIYTKPNLVFGICLGCSSDVYLQEGSDYSMGFYFVNKGYDVWLTNVRGNTYGAQHRTLGIDNAMFWEFCFLDIAKYDLPVQLDFIKYKSQSNELYYIGFSQGTAALLAMLQLRPEYNNLIAAAGLFASFRTMKHLKNTAPKIAIKLKELIYATILPVTKGALAVHGASSMRDILTILCDINPDLCVNLYQFIGFGSVDKDDVERYLKVIPSGTSLGNIYYYAQLAEDDAPKLYSHFGMFQNIFQYQSFTPPSLGADKITVPITLVSSSGDTLTPCEEMDDVFKALVNVRDKELLCYENDDFNHLHMLTWPNSSVRIELYNVVDEFLRRHELSKTEAGSEMLEYY